MSEEPAPPAGYGYGTWTQPGQLPTGYHQPYPSSWGAGGFAPPPPRRRGVSTAILIVLGTLGLSAFVLVVIAAATVGRNANDAGHSDVQSVRPSPHPGPSKPAPNPGTPDAVLQQNEIYRTGPLAPVSCPAAALGSATKQEQTDFYQGLMSCLDKTWAPNVEEAGFSFTDPGLVVFDTAVSTPCGTFSPQTGSILAFYCPGDSVMYADVNQMKKSFGTFDVAYAITIGHEFGHHIQLETGQTRAEQQAVYASYSRKLDLSRRRELQASCYGGLFLGSIKSSYPMTAEKEQQLDRISGFFGDTADAPANRRDHGSGMSNHYWIMKAYHDDNVDACDVWAAPDSLTQ